MRRTLMTIMGLAMGAICLNAQNSDFGIWTSVGAEKKLDKNISVGMEGEMRTRDNTKTVDRWTVGAYAGYKLVKNLKLSAGYDFMRCNNPEKISYHSDGDRNNWRPSFWTTKHRVNISLTGNVNMGAWNISLRERWQYTYRPAKTTSRYDYDNSWWETTDVGVRIKNVLRSRFQLEYNISHCELTPYTNVELYNAWNLQKVRYTLGAQHKVNKHHSVGLYYRYQSVSSTYDDDEPDRHILGFDYKFNF